jgi:predicted  nucleic acid-binding Zn-ribbon protein
MYYNPSAAKLRATDDEIKELEHRRADLVEQVAWATRLNSEEEVDQIARLRSDLEERTAELGRLEADISELDATSRLLASQTPALERDTRLGWRVLRWFTTEYGLAKARLMAHEQELADLHSRVQVADEKREQVARVVAELTDHIFDNEQALARFRSFRSVEADEAIAKIDRELSLLQKKRDHLKARAAYVDCRVEAPLAELRKYESEIEDHESTISKLRSELPGLEGRMAEAERFDKKISSAANSYGKAKLHQECERRFGYGSPRAAIRAIRSQIHSLLSSIGDHERQIDRLRRDMAKTEQRITKLVAVAAREIDALIIDGNNCCYQGNDFIGLAALIPMTENLSKRYALTVVFDAAIRRLLGVGDDDLRAALPAAEVHVVASRSKADETILDAADEPTAWVVSNDRFGDYRDKTSVKERRVIRHEILRGRILVHDLDLNEPLAVPSGT